MNNYGFTVRVVGIDTQRDDFPDVLYEAGCDDALVMVRGNQVLLDFHREENTFDDAVASASRCIEMAGGKVTQIEPLPD